MNNDMFLCRNGTQDKIPMKLLNRVHESKPPQPTNSDSLSLDLNFLLKPLNGQKKHEDNLPTQDTNDDFLVDISDEKMLQIENTFEVDKNTKCIHPEQNQKSDIKLNDIFINLEDIKPSSHPPITILEEKNGITINVHLAKDKPKIGVNVYVITTVSKNEFPLSNYLFQAVIPKVSTSIT